MSIAALTLCLALAPMPGGPDDGTNLLRNGDAEAGDRQPEHWRRGRPVKGVEFLWDRGGGLEGGAALGLRKTIERYWPIAEWNQAFDHAPGRTRLLVTAAVRSESAHKAILDAQFVDDAGQWQHAWVAYIGARQAGAPPANHDWARYSGVVAVPAGTREITIGLQVYGPGTVWFDDVLATYVPEDTPTTDAIAAQPNPLAGGEDSLVGGEATRPAVPAPVPVPVPAPAPAAAPARARTEVAMANAQWLAVNARPIRSIDPGDEDFEDLRPLAEAIGTARVVALGEQSHGDGATFLAKHRLVRFLHQEMGFDVLAWESGLYGCREMDRAIVAGRDPAEAWRLGLFPIWGESGQIAPLLDYVASTRSMPRRLETAGFDCQLSSRASRESFAATVERFFDQADADLLTAPQRADLRWLVAHLDDSDAAAGPRDRARVSITRIISAMDTHGERLARVHDRREIAFTRKVLENLLVFEEIQRSPPEADTAPDPSRTNRRDRAMGENLAWLVNERYPDRKIIVWAASFHLMREAPSVKWLYGHGSYATTVPMGNVAHAALGDDYYSIMFTCLEGSAGNPFHGPRELPRAEVGSLEDLFDAAGLQHAFLDLRRWPAGGEWLAGPQNARPLGYTPMEADWTRVFDGIVYTRTMFPSTREGEVPPGVRAPRVAAPPAGAALEALVERYRQTVIGYGLGFDSVHPSRPWTGWDEDRLARFPGPGAWPQVLGHIHTDAARFRLIAAGEMSPDTVLAATAFEGPLRETVVAEGSATVALLAGAEPDGALVTKAYASLLCSGPMAGTMLFESYATAWITGDLLGRMTALSYFNAVIEGELSGTLSLDSYAMVYVLGGFTGAIEMKSSRVFIAGHTPRSSLKRISGTGRVFVERSDLPAGRHEINGIEVTVGDGS